MDVYWPPHTNTGSGEEISCTDCSQPAQTVGEGGKEVGGGIPGWQERRWSQGRWGGSRRSLRLLISPQFYITSGGSVELSRPLGCCSPTRGKAHNRYILDHKGMPLECSFLGYERTRAPFFPVLIVTPTHCLFCFYSTVVFCQFHFIFYSCFQKFQDLKICSTRQALSYTPYFTQSEICFSAIWVLVGLTWCLVFDWAFSAGENSTLAENKGIVMPEQSNVQCRLTSCFQQWPA